MDTDEGSYSIFPWKGMGVGQAVEPKGGALIVPGWLMTRKTGTGTQYLFLGRELGGTERDRQAPGTAVYQN
jgi:hypothetical protein